MRAGGSAAPDEPGGARRALEDVLLRGFRGAELGAAAGCPFAPAPAEPETTKDEPSVGSVVARAMPRAARSIDEDRAVDLEETMLDVELKPHFEHEVRVPTLCLPRGLDLLSGQHPILGFQVIEPVRRRWIERWDIELVPDRTGSHGRGEAHTLTPAQEARVTPEPQRLERVLAVDLILAALVPRH